MARSVLDELRDACRRAKPREPTLADLLAFDPAFDTELLHAYRDHVRGLEDAYDRLVHRGEDEATLKLITEQVDSFWKFVLAQLDGLRLFQLMRWWRQDRGGKGGWHGGSPGEDVAYLLTVVRLLEYAVADKGYEANIRARSFTKEEWAIVKTPMRGRYLSSYETLLANAFVNVPKFARDMELFLRLHAFGRRNGGWLATNEEIEHVMTASLAATPADLNARSFSTETMEKRTRKTRFKIGETVGNSVYVVYFEGNAPRDIYVNFAHTGGVLYQVPIVEFVRFADQAEYELIYDLTKGLLVLIPLLFDVMIMVPGVVAGGFPALVEALLQPVEAKAAEKVMEAMGLDPDKAGWVVLGINILAHRLAPGEATVETPIVEAEEGGWWDRGVKARASEETETGARATEKPTATSETAGARPRMAANDNAGINWGKAAANENRLAEPTLADLEKHALTAERAEQAATEIAELERIEMELAEETEEIGEAVAVAGGKGGRSRSVGSRATTPTSRGVVSKGASSSTGTGGGRGAAKGPTVLDEALCARKGINPEMKSWLEDVAAEWRAQWKRFENTKGSASYRGQQAHDATQRAIKAKYPETVAEELTGVSGSPKSTVMDLGQRPHAGAVAELKPWAFRMKNGQLATSRAAIVDEVETFQMEAYGVVDRGVGRPTFVFTADGKVWTPNPGAEGWIRIGAPR